MEFTQIHDDSNGIAFISLFIKPPGANWGERVIGGLLAEPDDATGIVDGLDIPMLNDPEGRWLVGWGHQVSKRTLVCPRRQSVHSVSELGIGNSLKHQHVYLRQPGCRT